jgi:hypothetical protein
LVEAGGDIGIVGRPTREESVEIFQRPRMAASQPPYLIQLILFEAV